MIPRPGIVSTFCVAIVSALSAVAVVNIITSCDQKQVPLNPTPENPCGMSGYYFACPGGGCCWPGTRCGVEGHACGIKDCCFEGQGPMFGSTPDAAAAAPQITPGEARRREGPPRSGR